MAVLSFLVAVSVAMFWAKPTHAAEVAVPPGGGLAASIAVAQPGDILKLSAGTYDGPLQIDRPLTVEGAPGAIIDGHRKGRTIEVAAPDVTIRSVELRGSGLSLERIDFGRVPYENRGARPRRK